jgi:hypothetical protein
MSHTERERERERDRHYSPGSHVGAQRHLDAARGAASDGDVKKHD